MTIKKLPLQSQDNYNAPVQFSLIWKCPDPFFCVTMPHINLRDTHFVLQMWNMY